MPSSPSVLCLSRRRLMSAHAVDDPRDDGLRTHDSSSSGPYERGIVPPSRTSVRFGAVPSGGHVWATARMGVGGSSAVAGGLVTELGGAAALDAVTALLVRPLRIPYSVALVIVGLAAGALLPPGAIQVTPELVLLVLVPGLVFEAALRLELPALRQTFGWMALLAVPGVLIS